VITIMTLGLASGIVNSLSSGISRLWGLRFLVIDSRFEDRIKRENWQLRMHG
jgi:hypothetical protein